MCGSVARKLGRGLSSHQEAAGQLTVQHLTGCATAHCATQTTKSLLVGGGETEHSIRVLMLAISDSQAL